VILARAFAVLPFVALDVEPMDSLPKSLKHWRNRPAVTGVMIVAPPPLSSCGPCRDAHGTVHPIEEALEEPPLPHEDCEQDDCRCTYRAVLEPAK
jgi:hypothetical protein